MHDAESQNRRSKQKKFFLSSVRSDYCFTIRFHLKISKGKRNNHTVADFLNLIEFYGYIGGV